MPPHNRNWFEGYRLLTLLILVLVGLSVWLASMRHFDV
ncbi:MAG: hypothetical protein V7634_1883, partial [Bradyrhizobium sp.]